jgi:hypothetical protein
MPLAPVPGSTSQCLYHPMTAQMIHKALSDDGQRQRKNMDPGFFECLNATAHQSNVRDRYDNLIVGNATFGIQCLTSCKAETM